MNKKSVLDILDQLPPSARKKAEILYGFYDQYVTSTPKKTTYTSITESPFVGIWKDREDLKDI